MSAFDLHEALCGSIRRLHHIQRYSSVPVIKPETVATHSWQCAFIGLLVATDIEASEAVSISVPEVVRRCLLHDISEAISGDIIRTYKYGTRRMAEATKEADNRNTYSLTREWGEYVGDALYLTWCEAKADDLEGDIVRFADAMCVVTYCAEEYAMGNRQLVPLLDACYRDVIEPFLEHEYLKVYVHQMFPHNHPDDVYRNTQSWRAPWTNPTT